VAVVEPGQCQVLSELACPFDFVPLAEVVAVGEDRVGAGSHVGGLSVVGFVDGEDVGLAAVAGAPGAAGGGLVPVGVAAVGAGEDGAVCGEACVDGGGEEAYLD